MKTILVTGAAGYIGRHVVKNALDRGYRVIAADFNFKGVDERAEFCDVPLFGGDATCTASWAARTSASIWLGATASAIIPPPHEGSVQPCDVFEHADRRRPEGPERHGHDA